MVKQNGFTLVELLIVIVIIGIIIGFATPNYNMIRERARITAQKMNMHAVAQAVEMYHAEKGEYTEYFYEEDYGAYFPGGDPDAEPPVGGKLPRNPWTGLTMDPEDIETDWYENQQDVTNTSIGGPNDESDYEPGQMRFGTYTPPGSNRITMWGLIGMDKNGRSIREFSAAHDEVIIFVLHN